MRKDLFVLVCVALLAPSGKAQGQKAMRAQRQVAQAHPTQLVLREIPSEMTRRFSAFHPALQPSAKSWVEQQAQQEVQKPAPDVAALRNVIRNRFPALEPSSSAGLKMKATLGGGIEAMAFIVLMQTTNDMDKDLKAVMAHVKVINDAKQKLRDLISKINTEIAENAGRPSARCQTPFCQSLPSQLKELSMATSGLQRPVRLDAPADLSYPNLGGLRDQMKLNLDSLGATSSLHEMRLQQMMERRAKFFEALSNCMKKTSDAQASIIQNLK